MSRSGWVEVVGLLLGSTAAALAIIGAILYLAAHDPCAEYQPTGRTTVIMQPITCWRTVGKVSSPYTCGFFPLTIHERRCVRMKEGTK